MRERQILEFSQQVLYDFFLDIVKRQPPEIVLLAFERLFFLFQEAKYPEAFQAVEALVRSQQEGEFQYALQRCCYILINNWRLSPGQLPHVQRLIDLFQHESLSLDSHHRQIRVLRGWLRNFAAGDSYRKMQLYAMRTPPPSRASWCDRYDTFLLASQTVNYRNPIEQRQIAAALSRRIKRQFRFELALFTARAKPDKFLDRRSRNPTGLGKQVVQIVKTLLLRRNRLTYRELADRFLLQNIEVTVEEYKLNAIRFLEFPSYNLAIAAALKIELYAKMATFYAGHDRRTIDVETMVKICNRTIDLLTFDEKHGPRRLLGLFLSEGNPLDLVILLLKVVLICEFSRTHLEARVANLIEYYGNYEESECGALIHFLEMLNVALCVYSEETQYDLVNMMGTVNSEPRLINLANFRIFSQSKQN